MVGGLTCSDAFSNVHRRSAHQVWSTFDNIFVSHRCWVILACASFSLFRSTINDSNPVVLPLRTMNGAELLDPMVVEHLTRASVLARPKEQSNDRDKRAQCLMRSARRIPETRVDMAKRSSVELTSSSSASDVFEEGKVKSRNLGKPAPQMRREMSSFDNRVASYTSLVATAGLVVMFLLTTMMFGPKEKSM